MGVEITEISLHYGKYNQRTINYKESGRVIKNPSVECRFDAYAENEISEVVLIFDKFKTDGTCLACGCYWDFTCDFENVMIKFNNNYELTVDVTSQAGLKSLYTVLDRYCKTGNPNDGETINAEDIMDPIF